MTKLVTALFCAILASVSWTAAQEDEKAAASPNGLYEVRERWSDAGVVEKCGLFDRKTGKRLLDLAASLQLKDAAENTEILWREDSQAFAFHYLIRHSGWTILYRKEKGGFRRLALPKLPPMRADDGREIPDTELIITGDSIYPIRWEKDGSLILEEYRIYNGGEWDSTYRKIVVEVPERGGLKIREAIRIEESMQEAGGG